jgi:hypothetical protein
MPLPFCINTHKKTLLILTYKATLLV